MDLENINIVKTDNTDYINKDKYTIDQEEFKNFNIVKTDNTDYINKDKYTIDQEEFKNFKNNAIEFLNLQSEIKQQKQQLSDITKKSKDLEKIIKDYMNDNNIFDHDTKKGIVKFIKTYQKPFRNKTTTKKKLSEYFNSAEKATECLKYIDNIEKVEKTSLKILLK